MRLGREAGWAVKELGVRELMWPITTAKGLPVARAKSTRPSVAPARARRRGRERGGKGERYL